MREAVAQEMQRDERVLVFGQGIDDFKAMYGTTRGLAEQFGSSRVFDTPLAEEGMTGVAIGLALAGMRPIHTHIRMDFVLLAMNQIVNIAAKARYMYGGRV
ncbi:MAG TPA: alpha-ketoacid dehydrogenase subunit beta, partial [Pirellulales bacterium]|nr:alpha-ketoacid dehydrogenase subunit beta [Pirellulales bacterium]